MSEMYTHRQAHLEDLPHICLFPQNPVELFFMFPKATYPLTLEQFKINFSNRSDSTLFLSGETIVGYANLYDVEPGRKCTMEKRKDFEGKPILAVYMKKNLM